MESTEREIVLLAWSSAPLHLSNLGWFPMLVRDNGIIYRHPTFALHLHRYPARLQVGSYHSIRIEPGDLTLTPALVNSHYELEHDGEHWCVHFTPGKPVPAPTAEPSLELALALPLHWPAGAHSAGLVPRLAWLAEMGRQRSAPGSEGQLAREAAESGVRELLLWLHFASQGGVGVTEPGALRSRAESAVTELVHLLESQYEQEFSAKELAARVGMNANYLARIFRERYGSTIAQFLLRRRVEAAQHLLQATTLRVKEIGAAVGLADAQKFNKAFRQVAGCSPSAYRRRRE